MTTWQELIKKEGHAPEWPYPIRYEEENEIEADILVIGGGIAGCWAAISAARMGSKVALVEKGDTIRSGSGGPGCDNWCEVARHPLIDINPDEWVQGQIESLGGYTCGIGREIQCRENYDALLEMEKMGGKIRDFNGEYKGCVGYDEKTKFVVYLGGSQLPEVLVWGESFKPLLKKECQRLGVKIFDRVMATSLLTKEGGQRKRVIGATGVNSRTGEFLIFKAKATILSTAGSWAIWVFNTELGGYTNFRSRTMSGDGTAIAWRAGAELTMMEMSAILSVGTGYKHKWYTGAGDASYRNVPIVDSNGKPLPVPIKKWSNKEGRVWSMALHTWGNARDAVLKGDYSLPFYGDFPAMPEMERKATWNLMLGQEATTKIIVDTYSKAGFDPSKDLLQCYQIIEGDSLPQWREARGGGLVVDWDLKTSLDGLYAAGEQLFAPKDHSFAAATGRYAGRKAAIYAKENELSAISKEQIAIEKARVLAPIKRNNGIEWKELHAGIARTMQYFCSEYKTEALFKMGLDSLQNIEQIWVPKLYALDPHKLMRSLEDLSLLTVAQIIIHASLARKSSSRLLNFNRIDYPQLDPPEWNKFITIKLENDKVKVGELPLGYCGNLKENYESRNRNYAGVFQE